MASGLGAQTYTNAIGQEDPFAREGEFWKQRAFPFDRIPEGAYERALTHAERLRQRKGAAVTLAAQPQWRLIGPTNIGGRTRTVVHHPTRPGIVYVGAAGGGIWRTTDHGQSWEPLFDNGVSLSIVLACQLGICCAPFGKL